MKNFTHSWLKSNDFDTLLCYFLTVLQKPKTLQTREKNQRKENKNNKKKETAQREQDNFKSLKFDQFHLKRKNNYMRKCNKFRQNFHSV